MMIESGLIAEGSTKGLLSGSHFNRCKRIHPTAALAFKKLHFESFLKSYENKTHTGKLYLNEVAEILESASSEPENSDFTTFALKDILEHYDLYTQETLNGAHGKTATFVMIYVWLIELYQLHERAIRTSDLNLYIYAGYEMCALFFTFNHQNYARWLSKNLDDLMNIEQTHPNLSQEFHTGALSIRRTNKNFCRSAIDLTLEQTINANAANKLTGISSFTNSINARKRWSETHSIRKSIITHLLESLELNIVNDCTESEYQSKVFNEQLRKFTEEVSKNINPFSSDINKAKLFNLSSGKAASDETAEFLLNVQSLGRTQMNTFITECVIDKNRFDRPIKRNCIKSFVSERTKSKNTKIQHIHETRTERNILGQVLLLALNNKINLLNLLSYPLAAVPQSLAHSDGTIISNCRKGELSSLLLSKVNADKLQNINRPTIIDVDIIDGFYLLSKIKDSPRKYGDLARFVLQRICNTEASEVHIIFDKHVNPSPRDMYVRDRDELYAESVSNFRIEGPNQQVCASVTKYLTNSSFREELINFFIHHWIDDCATNEILDGKRVFLSFGNKCHLFSNGLEKGKTLPSFENNHFEVESKMVLHISKILAMNILIKTANVDVVLMYLLYHMQSWQNEKVIWIETDDNSKNSMLLIDVRQIFRILTPDFINALPSWYIFSGCSYEPSFYGKGKKTCMKVLEKKREYQVAFGNIGSDENSIKEDDISVLEEYTCQLYSSKCKDVNNARLDIFQKAYGSKDEIDFNKKGFYKLLQIIFLWNFKI